MVNFAHNHVVLFTTSVFRLRENSHKYSLIFFSASPVQSLSYTEYMRIMTLFYVHFYLCTLLQQLCSSFTTSFFLVDCFFSIFQPFTIGSCFPVILLFHKLTAIVGYNLFQNSWWCFAAMPFIQAFYHVCFPMQQQHKYIVLIKPQLLNNKTSSVEKL